MADGVVCCLNLNSLMYFRVRSRSLVTFKTKLYVTTVNTSFQPLFISCHKEFYLSYFIGLELNIVTWYTKILKSIGSQITFPEVLAINYVDFSFLRSTVFSHGTSPFDLIKGKVKNKIQEKVTQGSAKFSVQFVKITFILLKCHISIYNSNDFYLYLFILSWKS